MTRVIDPRKLLSIVLLTCAHVGCSKSSQQAARAIPFRVHVGDLGFLGFSGVWVSQFVL